MANPTEPSQNEWYTTADAAEILDIQPNTVAKQFASYATASPDDNRLRKDKSDDSRGRPSWLVEGTLLNEMIASRSGTATPTRDPELRQQVQLLTAEVAQLRDELGVLRDAELTDTMSALRELDELRRKYKALAQVVAIDAQLDV